MNNQLKVILSLTDAEFKKGIAGVQGQLNAFGARAQKIGQDAGIAFLGLGSAILGLVKTSAGFERSMANISTIVDTNVESMDEMKASVLDLAKRTPVAIGDLSQALYDVRSAGFGAKDSMNLLEESGKLAVAGLATTAESTNIMTSALSAFKAEGLSASQVANILFTSVQYGKQTVADMSQAFGAVAPILQNAGVSLADFAAGTASLTSLGVPAAEAQNEIRAAVVSLLKPTEEMQVIFQRLGVESGPELIRASGGIGGAFEKMRDAAQLSGIALEKATGRVEGASAILAIAGSGNATYVKSLADMTSGINVLDEAYKKQAETLNAKYQVAMNRVQTAAISLGSEFRAALIPILDAAGSAADKLSVFLSKIPTPVKQAAATILLATTAVLGLVSGFGFVFGAVSKGISAVLSMGGAFKALGPIFTAVRVAIVAVAAIFGTSTAVIWGWIAAIVALGVAWKTNFLGIQTVTRQVAAFVQLVWNDAVKAIGGAFNTLGVWAQKTFGGIIDSAARFFTGLGAMLGQFLGGLGQFGKGVIDFVIRLMGEIGKIVQKGMQNQVDALNVVLGALGQKKIDVSTAINSIKGGLSGAADYVSAKWAQAGASIQKSIASAAAAAKAGAVGASVSAVGTGGKDAVSTVDPDKAAGGGKDAADKAKREAEKAAKEAAEKVQRDQSGALAKAQDELTQSLLLNDQAMQKTINGMGIYASEAAKLRTTLAKLVQDEATLKATRDKLAASKFAGEAETARLEALKDINNQIVQNAIDHKKAETELTRVGVEGAQKRAEAERQLAAAKQELNNDAIKRQEDFELAHLKTLYAKKQITAEEYYGRLDKITQAQALREVELLQVQIENLEIKKQQVEAINGVTEESLALQQQILELENQISAARDTAAQKQIENGEALKLASEAYVVDTLANFQRIANGFTSTVVDGLIAGNLKIGEAFKKLGQDLLRSLLNQSLNKISEEFFGFFKKLILNSDISFKAIGSALTKFMAALGSAFSFIGKAAVGLFDFITSGAISGLKSVFAAVKAGSFAAAVASAHEMALAAAKAVAGIPIVGPALAMATYGAMLAFGLGKAALINGIAAFDVGSGNIPFDMPAMVHQGEIIVPANFSDALRRGDLSLSGPTAKGQNDAAGGPTIVFNNPVFMGFGPEAIEQIERGLEQKLRIVGGSLALRNSG